MQHTRPAHSMPCMEARELACCPAPWPSMAVPLSHFADQFYTNLEYLDLQYFPVNLEDYEGTRYALSLWPSPKGHCHAACCCRRRRPHAAGCLSKVGPAPLATHHSPVPPLLLASCSDRPECELVPGGTRRHDSRYDQSGALVNCNLWLGQQVRSPHTRLPCLPLLAFLHPASTRGEAEVGCCAVCMLPLPTAHTSLPAHCSPFTSL